MLSFSAFETHRLAGLSVRRAGTGDPLILLHGFPEDGALWRHVAPLLAEKHTVLVPDLPGAGASPRPEAALTMEGMADAIIAALDAGGIRRAVVAGHSMGGYVALALAERHPDRVAGLALIHSTAAADTAEKQEHRRKSAALLRKGGKDAFVRGAVAALFAPSFRDAHPAIVEEQTDRALELDAESLAQFTEAMSARTERKALLKTTATPVHWVLGDQDSVLPLDAVLSQAPLAAVSFLSLYAGCGHLSPLEAPHRLAADLARFAANAFLH